jgi:hypothetical protein
MSFYLFMNVLALDFAVNNRVNINIAVSLVSVDDVFLQDNNASG